MRFRQGCDRFVDKFMEIRKQMCLQVIYNVLRRHIYRHYVGLVFKHKLKAYMLQKLV